MSYYTVISNIYVQGPKEGIVKMLNTAIRNAGSKNIIAADDNIETINEKVKVNDGGRKLKIAITDLMDEQCLKDSILQEKKSEYDKHIECLNDVLAGKVKFGNEKEEKIAYLGAKGELEDMCDGRLIDILEVLEVDGNYRVRMHSDIPDDVPLFPEWADWGDVCRLYGYQVIIDEEQCECNGPAGPAFYSGTIIYEMEDGNVKKTSIYPENAISIFKYEDEFDKLITIDPERYRKFKIQSMEEIVKDLQFRIDAEKQLLLPDRIREMQGLFDESENVTEEEENALENTPRDIDAGTPTDDDDELPF